jgi:hypothetical protein
MATATPARRRTKKQDEAPAESGAALPGGVTLAVNGEPTTPDEQEAEAQTLEQAQEADEKAARSSIVVEEVDELPVSTKNAPKKAGPSVWALRLKAVSETKSGKARIFTCEKVATATSMAWRVRKQLAKGDFDSVLGEGSAERFQIVTSEGSIFGVELREEEAPAESSE